jgi:branched-chain amino acid transport system ATP-binding protein
MPETEAAAPLLAVAGLTVRFGGVTALNDVSFDVAAGHITGLIGPNGAGKTTAFNCITRLYQPAAGKIVFHGADLLELPPHRIAQHRIARTFQNVALFGRMSVLDNVLVGGHALQAPERAARADALEILGYLGLEAWRDAPVTQLPFGTRKTVELARALAARPELLLLDEPASGLSNAEVTALSERIGRIARDFSTTVFMVEHHMRLVMGICDHVIVLASGRKLCEGRPEFVQRDPAVVEAYLGAA